MTEGEEGEVRAKRTIDGVTSVCWREINHERNSPGLGRIQRSVVRYIQDGVIRRSRTDAIHSSTRCIMPYGVIHTVYYIHTSTGADTLSRREPALTRLAQCHGVRGSCNLPSFRP